MAQDNLTLEQRIRAIEDRLEIYNLIAGHPPSADTGADYYARAMEADPQYPLAHFNLGNLYDEQGNFEDASRHYLEAIRLSPRYADAYFNLALLCERNNQVLKAIGYWQTYLKLDSTSSWASAARKQLDRLKRTVRSK